jgi:hypothetical protein
MTTGRLALAYCQARLQARYGILPGEGEWLRLAGAGNLAAYLEEARTGPLQPWIRGFSGHSGAHDIERGLRDLGWDLVSEVAGWVPAPWRAAVRWTAWLPFLPILGQLIHRAQAPRWAAQDPRICPLLNPDGTPNLAAIASTGFAVPPAARPAVAADPAQLAQVWSETWQRLWPIPRPRSRTGWPQTANNRELNELTALLAGHLAAFRRADPSTAWDLRRTLRERLRVLFHQRTLTPVAILVYLALVLLDLERLRAELLRRALFPRLETA